MRKNLFDLEYALDLTAIIAITDAEGKIVYVNENCAKLSGYSAEDIFNNKDLIAHAGYLHKDKYEDVWRSIKSGNMWVGEMRSQNKNGDSYWVKATIIPSFNESNEPTGFCAVSENITDKKNLEVMLKTNQHNQALKMAATAIDAQEKERNYIGGELHDNVNQLLVATKLLVSLMLQKGNAKEELLRLCNKNILGAIEENRRIAKHLSAPDFDFEMLPDRIENLLTSMLAITGVKTKLDTFLYKDALINSQQKLAVYRMLQEQCTNIVRHACAKNVFINLETCDGHFKITITDDGKGIKPGNSIKGLGLKNIANRAKLLQGLVRTKSSPGEGFTLRIEIPLKPDHLLKRKFLHY